MVKSLSKTGSHVMLNSHATKTQLLVRASATATNRALDQAIKRMESDNVTTAGFFTGRSSSCYPRHRLQAGMWGYKG